MDLKEILAIAGQPGLYQFISQGRNGIIVESLVDKKRSSVPAAAKVSSMSDIAVFTEAEEKPLHEVLQAIKDKQNAGPAIDVKESTEDDLRKFFAEVLPTYDKERVYLSDVKKIISWYNILQKNSMMDFEVKEEEAAEEAKAEGEAVAEKPAKATKAAAPRKAAAAKPVAQKATSKAAGQGKISAPRKAQ
jgi:hypothetical protein